MNNLTDITIPKFKRMSQVNLDALIPREDLEIKDTKKSASKVSGISLASFRKGELFVESLRKPEFQRSTWEWTPDKVYNLVKSFTDGDLIPAIILWQGEGNNFVIDGAHRLSALIAWVNDDYGSGNISTVLFGSDMEAGQKKKAAEVKKMIEDKIGSYKDILWAGQNQAIAPKDRVQIAQRISSLSIDLQWVPGDASQAEASFFKINEAASPLDSTEKRLLKSRNKPMAIAARAIIRSGSGHKYWGKFLPENQLKIEQIAKEINTWLFNPQLETPLKTMDIPLAGKPYEQATQELVLNVVNFSNGIKIVDTSKTKNPDKYPEHTYSDDLIDGSETINFLSNTKKMLANLTGTQACSLGLHPLIYFYSKQGRYQITAFLAILHLIKDFEYRNQLIKFTTIRMQFENFIWDNKSLVHQAIPQWGSGAKGYIQLSKLFSFIINNFLDGKTDIDIINLLDKHEDYNFFKAGVRDFNPKKQQDFSSESKSETFIREGVKAALKCNICGGFLHKNSIQIDHDLEKENNGVGNADNGKLVHFFCGSSKKLLKSIGFLKS